MNPYQSLEIVDIPITKEALDRLKSTPTKIIVEPLNQKLVPNQNYIINLQIDSKTELSFVAKHRINTFSNALSTFNQLYSILSTTDYTTEYALETLNELVKKIKEKEKIEKIKDTYQLSIFNIQDKIDI